MNQVYHYVRYVRGCKHESSINKAFVSFPCLGRLSRDHTPVIHRSSPYCKSRALHPRRSKIQRLASVIDSLDNVVILHVWFVATTKSRVSGSPIAVLHSYTYLVSSYFHPQQLIRGIWCALTFIFLVVVCLTRLNLRSAKVRWHVSAITRLLTFNTR